MLLNNQWITEDIKEESKKCLDTNENKSTTIQNLQNTAETVTRGKFMAIQTFLWKQISYKQTLTLQVKQLEKEEQTQSLQKERNRKYQNRNK